MNKRIETALRAWWTCALETGKTSPQDGFRAGVAWAVRKMREKKRGKRSDPQNRYYWGVVIKILGDHLGYARQEMHDALRWQFLRVEHDNGPPSVKSTTELDTMQFEEYLEEVRLWAYHDFQVTIPLPNESEVIV